MGRHCLFSSVLRDDESTSLFDQSPLSATSSPLPLLQGKGTTRPAIRRHVVIRLICLPIAAICRATCARASTSDDQRPSNDAPGMEGGEARRRPSLEELLKMEASSLSRPEHKSPQDEVSYYPNKSAIVVFGITDDDTPMSCTGEVGQEPVSLSKNNHVVVSDDEEQTAIVPVELDAGQREVPAGGGAGMLSPAVQMNAKRLVVVLGSLRAFSRAPRIGMGLSEGPYWRLAGSRAACKKAELFYHRPIPMGRRCRVQHLEESPYM